MAIFITVPSGFVRALASKTIIIDEDEDIDSDSDGDDFAAPVRALRCSGHRPSCVLC